MAHRALLAPVVVVLTGCGGVSGALTADDSVEILEPAPMEIVAAPFEMRWEGDLGPGESFAVFLDRAVLAPGQSLDDAFEDACDGAKACPDELFLSARGVYVTDDEEVAIPLLAPRGGIDGATELDVHRATIVIVDDEGVRQGEGAWTTEFRVER